MSKKKDYIYSSHKAMLKELDIAEQPLSSLIKSIQEIYCSDSRPWIIGFSGGKDSTCILSLIYSALLDLKPEQRSKPIYVVSSDTLVETPVVVDMIDETINLINQQAKASGLPITAHKVVPESEKTFWASLLGRGYPAPTKTFRWCTERMKIDPVSRFITSKADQFGEVIVALGSRTQESASRAQAIKKHKSKGSNLGRHSSLSNAYTYMPIVDWSADDVWEYLMSAPCPWTGTNELLFELYKGSNQGECPLVIDKSTPSCGNSRFGCWTCTVVTEDKALHGLIESGADWMKPLLDFRNMLYKTTDPEQKKIFRNHKRRTGKVHYWSSIEDTTRKGKDGKLLTGDNGKVLRERTKAKADNLESKLSLGPYWMKYRQQWLKDLLQMEKVLKDTGHEFSILTIDELQVIRQQWLRDPNEPDWADSLPRIYSEVYGEENNIEWIENDAGAFTEPDAKLLDELGLKYNIPAELIMKLIEVELSVNGLGKRKGVLQKLETVLKKDWESLDEINKRNIETAKHDLWKDKIEDLKNQYNEVPA